MASREPTTTTTNPQSRIFPAVNCETPLAKTAAIIATKCDGIRQGKKAEISRSNVRLTLRKSRVCRHLAYIAVLGIPKFTLGIPQGITVIELQRA